MHCRPFQVVLTNTHHFEVECLIGRRWLLYSKCIRARRGVLLWRWWRTIQSLSCSYPSWCKCKSFFLHFSIEQIIPCVIFAGRDFNSFWGMVALWYHVPLCEEQQVPELLTQLIKIVLKRTLGQEFEIFHFQKQGNWKVKGHWNRADSWGYH